MARVAIASMIAVSVVCFSRAARADDPVEEAWRLYLSADFDGALAAFDRAEAGALDRGDVLRILEGRAQIHFALGDQEAARGALARLASLSPDYRLSPETPPDLVQAFEAMRRETPTIALAVTPERDGERLTLTGDLEGDVGGLVRALRITARPVGGDWMQAEDEPLVVELPSTEAAEYYAEAIGVGGAVLLFEGTAERPRRVTPDASGLAPIAEDEEGEGLPLWAWVAIGGGAALAAGILIAVIAVAASGGGVQAEAPVLP